ncbi:hypothetical protein ABEU20_002612 [Rhodococcus sp. PAM 2766]|uniref:Uncharacterized protein n=1 Tax=Rhodococcus parequi TaxID=3137122 RepID=A0ABW9FER0_9NOCA
MIDGKHRQESERTVAGRVSAKVGAHGVEDFDGAHVGRRNECVRVGGVQCLGVVADLAQGGGGNVTRA